MRVKFVFLSALGLGLFFLYRCLGFRVLWGGVMRV